MECNDQGISIIEHFEGFSTRPYLCPAGYWTIGYGNRWLADGTPVKADTAPITNTYGEVLLLLELEKVERKVKYLIKSPLTENQFSAVCSLVWNIGSGRFKASTLRAKLNRGDYEGAQAQFHLWRRAGGKILKGLVLRRAAEAELFGS